MEKIVNTSNYYTYTLQMRELLRIVGPRLSQYNSLEAEQELGPRFLGLQFRASYMVIRSRDFLLIRVISINDVTDYFKSLLY